MKVTGIKLVYWYYSLLEEITWKLGLEIGKRWNKAKVEEEEKAEAKAKAEVKLKTKDR